MKDPLDKAAGALYTGGVDPAQSTDPAPPAPAPFSKIFRADARAVPLSAASVDLICTSPPYYQLRDYGVAGQIGLESSVADFIDQLVAVMAECKRILKPTGSIFVNLGDKYDKGALLGTPWRFALACVDRLDLRIAAEIIWAKPSTTPRKCERRVKRIHEQWFHFTVQPNYFSGADELRSNVVPDVFNNLGREATSVWAIKSDQVSADESTHFAAYPLEWPRRIIQGWCPVGYCPACDTVKRPISYSTGGGSKTTEQTNKWRAHSDNFIHGMKQPSSPLQRKVVSHQCDCLLDLPTVPAVVFDPFTGSGTTLIAAKMLGRTGLGTELNPEYIELAYRRLKEPLPNTDHLQITKVQASLF